MSDQEEATVDEQYRRNRRAFVDAECHLDIASLVGSWFNVAEGGEVVWQGLVVAEPADGVYLVELEERHEGRVVARYQRLVPIEQMYDDRAEWRFYDTEDRMVEGFAQWSVPRRV